MAELIGINSYNSIREKSNPTADERAKNEIDEIADAISGESYDYSGEDDPVTYEMLERAFAALRNDGYYEERDSRLDFFILGQEIWKDRKEYLDNINAGR